MAIDTNYRAGIKLLFKNEWATFAATFARFEYAMKRAGYLKHDRTGATAEPGWDHFAADLGAEFYLNCLNIPELMVLIERPPRLLKVNKDRSVSWKKARAVNGVNDLLQLARDVRNSLFHGEKHVHADRDGDLINAAQSLLDHAWECALKRTDNPKLVSFVEAFRFVLL